MKESTSKERMLKKVRKALLEKKDNPYPNFEEGNLHPIYSGFLDVLFAEEFTKVGGHFLFCEDEIQFIENLIRLTEEKSWQKIHCWEPDLQNILARYDYPFSPTDLDFLEAEVGLTLCEALIARNGSILTSNRNTAGRRLSIYPPYHIVVAYTSQLVLDLKDGFKLIKDQYDVSLPSMISTITGPSRTADIEKTLVLGAHGPREIFLFLINDRAELT